MKTRLVLIFLLCMSAAAYARQTYSIKGSVSDTLNNVRLQYASVTLMRAEDSVMVSYDRANANGDFELHTDRSEERRVGKEC